MTNPPISKDAVICVDEEVTLTGFHSSADVSRLAESVPETWLSSLAAAIQLDRLPVEGSLVRVVHNMTFDARPIVLLAEPSWVDANSAHYTRARNAFNPSAKIRSTVSWREHEEYDMCELAMKVAARHHENKSIYSDLLNLPTKAVEVYTTVLAAVKVALPPTHQTRVRPIKEQPDQETSESAG